MRARRPDPLRSVPEASLQASVMELAALLGWRRAHFRPAQLPSGKWATHMSGEPGWPDLALARPGVLLCAELKRHGKRPTPEQVAWLDVLRTIPGVVVKVWRPSDWASGEIERTLMEPEKAGVNARPSEPSRASLAPKSAKTSPVRRNVVG